MAPIALVGAIENGLGVTPPMGWRSWNLYFDQVNQTLMTNIMDGMVSRKRMVDGQPTSLCDLGYCDVGLDDAWQACGQGTDSYNYHAKDTHGNWYPVVNTSRFPDLAAMTQHAHSLGLKAGWYGNNCICSEKKNETQEHYAGDVAAFRQYSFDSIKLDGCGQQNDMDLWSSLINSTGGPMVIENCHGYGPFPNVTHCPFNLFRTSTDIRPDYGSVVENLQSTIHFAAAGISRPGCWGYPDMLEVGVSHDTTLSLVEAQSHFGAWCVVSSPLTLSMDVNNDKLMDSIWPIVSNKEAIEVNQAWATGGCAGHSGSPFSESLKQADLPDVKVASWQIFRKPIGEGRVAVFFMNHDSMAQNVTLKFLDVPGLLCAQQSCNVRDVWNHKDMGAMKEMTVELPTHDSAFFVMSFVKETMEIFL